MKLVKYLLRVNEMIRIKIQTKSQEHQSSADTTAFSKSKDKVTIDLTSVEFAPLTNSENNQLKIIINYQTNDPLLINSPMAGTMKVYDSDDNVIKHQKLLMGMY